MSADVARLLRAAETSSALQPMVMAAQKHSTPLVSPAVLWARCASCATMDLRLPSALRPGR
eukprot:3174496-Alexandrium_andersonii.AAC.1